MRTIEIEIYTPKEICQMIKNDIIQVISKYMEIDTDALIIQITQTMVLCILTTSQ